MTKSIQDQKDAIARIMGGERPSGAPIFPKYSFPFGKYKGETLESVYYKDKQYLAWVNNKGSISVPSAVEDFLSEEL